MPLLLRQLCCIVLLVLVLLSLTREVFVKRGRMPRGHSRKVFRKGAQNVHPKNNVSVAGPMRGGIRL